LQELEQANQSILELKNKLLEMLSKTQNGAQ